MAQNNIMAVVAYIGMIVSLGWLTGLIVYLISKDDRVTRFHGMQAILFSIVYSILFAIVATVVIGGMFVLTMIAATQVGGFATILMLLAGALVGIIGLVVFALWVWVMWQAFNNKIYRLPLVGGLAENWSA